MLLLNDKKILIFTPNKCGSTSVNETLVDKMDAQLVLGPQGPWREHQCDYDDVIGKHSTFVPFWCKNWKKYMLTRNPFDRFVSLWRHYCKYHSHEVSFEEFIPIVEKYKADPPWGWFYTQRMCDFINSSPPDTELIDVTKIDDLAKILGTEAFPKLHATEHKDWQTYYTPALYRRVHDLA